MEIKITPSDIVKRGLWDNYAYYIIGTDKESEKVLKEDKEFIISENDALVIGLLKVLETTNLILRFNDYIIHYLTIKSISIENKIYIRKRSLEIVLEKFLSKFPKYWEPDIVYKNSLNDLIEYSNNFNKNLESIEVVNLPFKGINFELYSTNSIKKLLNFNNY
jgi:hypothetical protein